MKKNQTLFNCFDTKIQAEIVKGFKATLKKLNTDIQFVKIRKEDLCLPLLT